MMRGSGCVALLALMLACVPLAWADYEAGQRAWDSGQPVEAFGLWQTGAEAGDRRAMLALGRMYVQGLGVPQDYIEAHKWFSLAASRGEAAAVQARDALAEKMTPQQVATAQERALAWHSEVSGAPEVTDTPTSVAGTSAKAVREAQELLGALGYAPGSADGIWGKRSTQAYRAFLRDAGRPESQTLTRQGLQVLRELAKRWSAETDSGRDEPAAHAAPETSTAEARGIEDEELRALLRGSLVPVPEDLEKVRDLLEKGADPNAPDGSGRTAVHYAAGRQTRPGGTGILSLLLDSGGHCCSQDNQGDTPLHYAVAESLDGTSDNADILGRIRHLLAHGADPNQPNKRGYTPLHFSAKAGVSIKRANVINSLLHADGDRDRAAEDGNTPLHLAAGASVRLDSGHGYDIFSQSPLSGHDIAFFSDVFIIRALLGGPVNLNAVNGEGLTPLLVPLTPPRVQSNTISAVANATKAMLKAGADPNVTTPGNKTPLFLVLDLPEVLPSGPEDLTEDFVPVIRALLRAGADPDRKNGRGDTPLHAAIRMGWDKSVIEALLSGGANPCIKNFEERFLPIQLARGLGKTDIMNLLDRSGGTDDCAEAEERKLGLDQAARRRIQWCLKRKGFDPEPLDGQFHPRTREAIRHWQATRRQDQREATGYLVQGEPDALLASCPVAHVSPVCTGSEGNAGSPSGCWQELANQLGCYVWNPRPQPEATASWSGGCVDGKASGTGNITWRWRQGGGWKNSSAEGELRDGGFHGHWIHRQANGDVWEGPYVDSAPHGRHVQRGTRGRNWSCWKQGERVSKDVCEATSADRGMRATRRVNLRSGPGEAYENIDSLEADEQIRVNGEIGEWLWVTSSSGREGFVHVSALAMAEQACTIWVQGVPGLWSGPCVDGLASGRGTAKLVPLCKKGSGIRGDIECFYEGTARHGLAHGHGEISVTGSVRAVGSSGHYYLAEEGEYFAGIFLKGRKCYISTECREVSYSLRESSHYAQQLVNLMASDSLPTCKFMHEDNAAYWAGPCTNGLASGEGVAISSYWRYFGSARNGRAQRWGVFDGYIPAPPDRSPEQMDRVRSWVDEWNNGSPVSQDGWQCYYMPESFPHYDECQGENCCLRESGM